MCQITIYNIGGQYLIGNHTKAIGFYIGFAPVTTNSRCPFTGTDGDGDSVAECFGIALGTWDGPRLIVYFCVFARSCFTWEVEVDVLCHCRKSHRRDKGDN